MNVRTVTKDDEALISGMISKDAAHSAAGISFADVIEPGTSAFLFSDDTGNPLMVVRLGLALRVAIQFNTETPYRSAKYATEIMQWLKDKALQCGIKEMIIRPGGGAANFADRLGWLPFDGKVFEVN